MNLKGRKGTAVVNRTTPFRFRATFAMDPNRQQQNIPQLASLQQLQQLAAAGLVRTSANGGLVAPSGANVNVAGYRQPGLAGSAMAQLSPMAFGASPMAVGGRPPQMVMRPAYQMGGVNVNTGLAGLVPGMARPGAPGTPMAGQQRVAQRPPQPGQQQMKGGYPGPPRMPGQQGYPPAGGVPMPYQQGQGRPTAPGAGGPLPAPKIIEEPPMDFNRPKPAKRPTDKRLPQEVGIGKRHVVSISFL